jgi:hypothetical protein
MNGIGFCWNSNGDLNQGNYKDNYKQDLHMIHEKASGDTYYVEFLDNEAEGFYVDHCLNDLAWVTFSKG